MIHFDEVLKILNEKKFIFTCHSSNLFYIIRDVFGRISVYIVDEVVKEDLEESLKNSLISIIGEEWIYNVESVEPNSTFVSQLKESCILVEGTENVYFGERHITRLNWFGKENGKFKQKEMKSKVVTFYSFKGGLGRTTSLVLTALQLVRKGKKVIVIDFDLEAPGLSSVLVPEDNQYSKYGLVDYLVENQISNTLDIDEYVYTIQDKSLKGSEGGELYVVPASNINDDSTDLYLEKMGRIDFNTPKYNEKGNPISNLINQLNERYEPDFIFIDSRTGIHDVGGLTLTQYTDIAFLLFYGNKQNMSGLKMVLPKVIKADVPFYLINSPVPNSDEESRDVIEYYLENAHTLLCDIGYYTTESIPDLYEKNAEHYPYIVNYSMPAVLLNSNSKIKSLLDFEGDSNIYLKLAEQIASYDEDEVNEISSKIEKKELDKAQILSGIEQIMPGRLAASENEFFEDMDLEKKFYPLKEHRFIFEPDKFLILGSKGSGKSALFSVLEHPKYAKSLASYYDLSVKSIHNMRWVTGLKGDSDYPSQNTFDILSEKDDIVFYKSYWRLLALRYIYKNTDNLPTLDGQILEDIYSDSKIRELALDRVLTEKIENHFKLLDQFLKENDLKLTIVYDALDVLLGKDYRGKMISALIALWYEYLPRYKNIRVKIFLRDDIFEKEVRDIADKVKLRNYSERINWTYDELLAMVWKRMLQNSGEIAQIFKDLINNLGMILKNEDNLGYIPRADQDINKALIKFLIGERMGSGKAAFSYNWIKNHLADTNEKIVPRSILKLFAEAASKEIESGDLHSNNTIIRPRSLKEVMSEVSKDRVQDLLEEYREYEYLFDNLKEYLSKFPAYEQDLKDSFRRCGIPEGQEVTTIQDLVNIGVMKPYQRKNNDPIRYHIPDIFLIGLGLSRVGLKAIN